MAISIDQQVWLTNQLYENFFDGKIKESGDDLNFRCPFCGDSRKNKSKRRGHLSKSKGIFHCFNCGHSCSGFELIAKLKSVDERDVKKEFFKYSKDEYGTSLKESINSINSYSGENDAIEEPIKLYSDIDILPSWTEITKDCIEYLNKRHIFEAPGWNKRDILYYDRESDRLVFPWRKNGRIEYYQLRALRCYQNPKYLFPKGLKKKIYGLDKVTEDIPFVCFCEGILDAIWVRNCVAVGGIFPTVQQLNEINKTAYFDNIIWFSDNFWQDESSKKEILKRCKDYPRMRVFNWPKNCKYKDINEWICADKNFHKFWNEDFIMKNSVTLAQAKLIISFNR
jgi:transcription elongation factor Elf1